MQRLMGCKIVMKWKRYTSCRADGLTISSEELLSFMVQDPCQYKQWEEWEKHDRIS